MLSIDNKTHIINKIVFVEKQKNYVDNALQKLFSVIFRKKDILLFDYSLLNWKILNDEQKMVYNYLKFVKGTITYKSLGEIFGFHQRKVAYLLKINPFVYVIPCHRVIGANSIGGYQFSVELKKELLNFEKNT